MSFILPKDPLLELICMTLEAIISTTDMDINNKFSCSYYVVLATKKPEYFYNKSKEILVDDYWLHNVTFKDLCIDYKLVSLLFFGLQQDCLPKSHSQFDNLSTYITTTYKESHEEDDEEDDKEDDNENN